ncbi:MAG: hypothetical protein M0Z61_06170 [Nitrospiraceae bacterium]|nr:hypothetical protein [Nitrospiraceae bacterium]
MRRKTVPIFLTLWAVFVQLAFAGFHNGGVGECNGCHTVHRAPSIQAGTATQSGPYLLRGTDQGSTCLNCHSANQNLPSYQYISTPESLMPPGIPPGQMTPGGDFGWLKKNYTWTSGQSVLTDYGYMHGHDIVAADYRYAASPVHVTAPGGTYPAASLTCISCHDPHGEYRRTVNGTIVSSGLQNACGSGSYESSPDPTTNCPVGDYRLLGGAGYSPVSIPGFPFTSDPPSAVAPSNYNRPESVTQTRVAYGQGMSEWCANCHPAFLNSQPNTSGAYRHPAGNGAKLGFLANNYNAYVKTGDITGTRQTAYLSLVPFEEGTSDYNILKKHARSDDSYLVGADENSNVMCLTCHRAHASGWDYMLRFDSSFQTFITADPAGQTAWPGTDIVGDNSQAMGRSSRETARTYYDRPATKFTPYQRSLCNKCHVED